MAQVPKREPGDLGGIGGIGGAGGASGGAGLDEGVDKRQAARLGAAGVLLLAAVAFIVQNNDQVETTFLFFTVEASLWVSLLVAVALGVVIGMLVPVIRRRRAGDD